MQPAGRVPAPRPPADPAAARGSRLHAPPPLPAIRQHLKGWQQPLGAQPRSQPRGWGASAPAKGPAVRRHAVEHFSHQRRRALGPAEGACELTPPAKSAPRRGMVSGTAVLDGLADPCAARPPPAPWPPRPDRWAVLPTMWMARTRRQPARQPPPPRQAYRGRWAARRAPPGRGGRLQPFSERLHGNVCTSHVHCTGARSAPRSGPPWAGGGRARRRPPTAAACRAHLPGAKAARAVGRALVAGGGAGSCSGVQGASSAAPASHKAAAPAAAAPAWGAARTPVAGLRRRAPGEGGRQRRGAVKLVRWPGRQVGGAT